MKMHTFGSLIRIKSMVAIILYLITSADTVVLAVRRNEEKCLQ